MIRQILSAFSDKRNSTIQFSIPLPKPWKRPPSTPRVLRRSLLCCGDQQAISFIDKPNRRRTNLGEVFSRSTPNLIPADAVKAARAYSSLWEREQSTDSPGFKAQEKMKIRSAMIIFLTSHPRGWGMSPSRRRRILRATLAPSHSRLLLEFRRARPSMSSWGVRNVCSSPETPNSGP